MCAQLCDTVTLFEQPAKEALQGYKPVRQMVFCGMYPVDVLTTQLCAKLLKNAAERCFIL